MEAIIKESEKFYNKIKAMNEYNTIKSLFLTGFCNPVIKLKKGNLPFSVYRLDMLIEDKNDNKYQKYSMIQSYKYDDDDLIINIKETELIKSIREKYIKDLMRCCDSGIKEKSDIKEDSDKKNLSNSLNSHYKKHKIEPLDIIDDYKLDFYLGNVIKYILRSPYKGSEIEDITKAKNYLELYENRILNKKGIK